MIDLNIELDWKKFSPPLDKLFSLASDKTRMLAQRWEGVRGAPVFTVQGHYMQRGWTE